MRAVSADGVLSAKSSNVTRNATQHYLILLNEGKWLYIIKQIYKNTFVLLNRQRL